MTTPPCPDNAPRRCKLCGAAPDQPGLRLRQTTLYVCPACDLHYLDRHDPAEGDAPAELTADQLRYIEAHLAANARRLAARLQLVKTFTPLAGRSCLDVGTGVGQFLPLLADSGARGEGVEPSGLRRVYARQHFGLDLHRQPIEAAVWHARAGSFDLLTLWDVLEHVNNPRATLEAAFALLRPGGLLFVETDNRDRANYRLSTLLYRLTGGRAPLFLPEFYRPVPFGHKQILRPQQLYRLAANCGFAPLAATPRRPETANCPRPAYRPAGQTVLVARKPA